MKRAIINEIKTMKKFMVYDTKKTDSENLTEQFNLTDPPGFDGTGSGTGSGSGSGSGNRQSSPAVQIPSELVNSEGVKKFQDWLDANKPGWATGYADGKVNKGRGYGRFGPRTSKAWTTHKDAYLNPTLTDPDVMSVDDFQGADAVYSSTQPTTQTAAANTETTTKTDATAVPMDGTVPTNTPIETTDQKAPDSL